MKSENIKLSTGINNVLSKERIRSTDLTIADNVDIDLSGRVTRRKGRTRLVSGKITSLWSAGGPAFFVRSGVLNVMDDGSTYTPITAVSSEHVSYTDTGTFVAWSDGRKAGRIIGSDSVSLSVPVPTTSAEKLSSGHLPGGKITVAAVSLRGGEESAPSTLHITEDYKGIRINFAYNGLPKRVYATQPDSELLFHVSDVPAAAAYYDMNDLPESLMQMRTVGCREMPVGTLCGMHNARLLVAHGNQLWYSRPFEPGLTGFLDFVTFPAEVVGVDSLDTGVFVHTAEGSYWLKGADLANSEMTRLQVPPAVKNTNVVGRAEHLLDGAKPGLAAMWVSSPGIVVGLDSGDFAIITEGIYNVPKGTAGCGILNTLAGLPHYLSVLYS